MSRIKVLYKNILNKENLNSFFIAVLCTCGLISFVIGKENTIPIIEMIVFIVMELINFKDTKEKLKHFKFKNYILYIVGLLFILILFIYTDIYDIIPQNDKKCNSRATKIHVCKYRR